MDGAIIETGPVRTSGTFFDLVREKLEGLGDIRLPATSPVEYIFEGKRIPETEIFTNSQKGN
jgi:hypothetical protein